MRNTILLPLLFLTLTINAQSDKSPFLFEREGTKVTTFFAELYPYSSWGSLNNQSQSIFELAGGLLIKNKFYVAYFSASSPNLNKVAVPDIDSPEYQEWIEAGVRLDKVSANTEFLLVKFHHSGLKFGYLHNANKMVYWRTGVKWGFSGGFHMTEDQTFMGLFDNKVYKSKIMTLEPDFGVGINLLPWWRAHVDLGYRIVSVDERIISAADADSFTFSLGFSFGAFGKK